MNIKEICVPKGIRYLSEWNEFKLPDSPSIIDKQIPGCGFTEYCLTNNQNIILACPRRILLENKRDQHKEDVHLVKNYYLELEVDKEISFSKPINSEKAIQKLEEVLKEEQVANELANKNRGIIEKDLDSYITLRWTNNKSAKILVTYDSYRHVVEFLKSKNILQEFYTVVDEFQSIFVDSRFKADTELEFVSVLSDIQKLCYVSATPMLENYLEMMDEFKDLPYYKLDWSSKDPGRVSKPGLVLRNLRSMVKVSKDIIDSYRTGKFEKSARINKDGEAEVVESKEAVIYVNSINGIVSIIKKNKLQPDEVNILCANTTDNQKKITKELGKDFLIGRVPLKGEPRKMFTLCTRTVYLGADMYSDNARTFILSDANIDSMAVDISLDLPQILGRQRLESNPWKNKATVYIKTSFIKKKELAESFESFIQEKLDETEKLMNGYNEINDQKSKEALTRMFLRDLVAYNYRDHYIGVNRHKGSTMVPEINKLALISERRAFDIQQVDYADRFSVFNRIESTFEGSFDANVGMEIDNFMTEFNSTKLFYYKMKLLCTANLSEPARTSVLDMIPDYFKRFYMILGPERIRSLGYSYAKINAELNIGTGEIDGVIYSEFKVGDKITRSDIKLRLGKIYNNLEINKTPKATDLEKWFNVTRARIPIDGKYIDGLELLSKK